MNLNPEDLHRRLEQARAIKGARICSSRKLVRHHQRRSNGQGIRTYREQRRNGRGDYGPTWDYHQPGRGTRSSTPGWRFFRTIGPQDRPCAHIVPRRGLPCPPTPPVSPTSRFLGKCTSTCGAVPSDHLPAHTGLPPSYVFTAAPPTRDVEYMSAGSSESSSRDGLPGGPFRVDMSAGSLRSSSRDGLPGGPFRVPYTRPESHTLDRRTTRTSTPPLPR